MFLRLIENVIGHEDVRDHLLPALAMFHLTFKPRLMSDYEVTLVNDNSKYEWLEMSSRRLTLIP